MQNSDNLLSEKIAANSATQMENLIIAYSQLQLENERLKKKVTELQVQLNNLRKDSEKSEPRRYNATHKQIRNKGIK